MFTFEVALYVGMRLKKHTTYRLLHLSARSYPRHACPLCVVVFMHMHERRKSPQEMDGKAVNGTSGEAFGNLNAG